MESSNTRTLTFTQRLTRTTTNTKKMKFQCLFSATSFGLVTMGWLNGMGEAWTPSSLSLKSSSSSSSSWSTRRTTDSVTHLQSSANDNDMMNSMKQQAMDQMKNLTPQQIDQMLLEMETMNPVQKAALKAMGMDLEAMKSSMKMMKGTSTSCVLPFH